jgi:Uma2 family endonuclease
VFFYDVYRAYRDLNPRYSDEIPTLVVEVLSPNDRPNRVSRRVSQFLHWGVKVVWVVDPEERTVAIHYPTQLPEVYDDTQELPGGPALPDFRCRVAEFFFSLDEPPAP